MKKAISYIRISNKDQSNFSLSGQEQYIKEYCERKDIQISNSFIDNGQSAKNFDRADWRKLEDFVKINYQNIDYLIVVKYDRFSRNTAQGLNMIDNLERKYGISVLSVFEEISIPPESPFFFKMRTDMLVQAEFELRVIRDRTKMGINQAKKEGRWVSRAPFGYKNIRDERGKPALEVNESQAEVIRTMFKMHREGTPLKEISKAARKMGFSLDGNSAVTRVLTNSIYAGYIPMDNELLKGNHTALIDQETYTITMQSFKTTKPKLIINDEVPLRGAVRCFCGRILTAGQSKGKTTHHWYYKCKSHLNININAKGMHSKMLDLMHELSLSKQEIDDLKTVSEELLKKNLANRGRRMPTLKRNLNEAKKKLESLEEKFISNELNYETYSKWRTFYTGQVNELTQKINLNQEIGIWEIYQDQIGKLTDMGAVFEICPTLEKQNVIKAVFNHSLKYELNSFSSSYLLDIFKSNELMLKEKGLLNISSPALEIVKTPISSGNGNIVELFEIFKRLTG